MRNITVEGRSALARGAAILGTGGGGDPHVGRLLAAQAMKSRGTIEVTSVEDVPDHASGLPVGMMSAPTVMIEKLPSAESVGEAVTALARYLERKPTHIACIEAGDVNSTVSFVAAAELGLPIIDGDGMVEPFPSSRWCCRHWQASL